MSGIIWIIVVGFIAGIIARFLSPGPNNPSGFILTTILGIAGAFLATWVGGGANKTISPGDLGNALGADQINQLTSQTGMSRDDLLTGLSQYMPKVIDHLTPDGRLPTDDEVSGRL